MTRGHGWLWTYWVWVRIMVVEGLKEQLGGVEAEAAEISFSLEMPGSRRKRTEWGWGASGWVGIRGSSRSSAGENWWGRAQKRPERKTVTPFSPGCKPSLARPRFQSTWIKLSSETLRVFQAGLEGPAGGLKSDFRNSNASMMSVL